MRIFIFLSLLTLNAFAFELPETEVLLSQYRPTIQTPAMTTDEQALTVKQMSLIFDQIYTHTDLKIDFFHNPNLDPVPRMASLPITTPANALQLVQQISRITLDLRDPHQSYDMPRPYSCLRTYVPLELGFASYVPFDRRIVVKSINIKNIKNPDLQNQMRNLLQDLQVGDVVNQIDGTDVWSALDTAAIYGGGSNEDAHLYEGLFMMTYVSQRTRAIPETDSMTIVLQTNAGEKTITIPYLVKTSAACKPETKKLRPMFTRQNTPTLHISRSHPFSADFRQDSARKKTRLQSRAMNFGNYTPSAEPTVGSATIQINQHNYGYLRISEFSPEKDIQTAQSEIARISKEFETTTEGLIIDVRGNPGGEYGDYLTQFYSKIPVVSQIEEIRASELNEMILEKMKNSTDDEWLLSYYDSVKKGRAEGRKYTERLPINKPEYLNDTGRVYTKPVILLADPSCYSYCDYFSTSMQDHQAAEVWIENGKHTGGGGASVTSYESFAKLLPEQMPALPQSQKMGVAFSSGFRTGAKAGVPIENFGADADHVYHTTFNDMKKDDADLLKALDQRLQEMK